MTATPGTTAAPPLQELKAGEVIETKIDGEDVVLIGTVLTGYTAILRPTGWETFQRWKLTTPRVSKGALHAAGKGRAGGFAAARFLLTAPRNHIVRHRNGNPFDIRLANIVSIPRGLVKQARSKPRGGQDTGTLTCGGGTGTVTRASLSRPRARSSASPTSLPETQDSLAQSLKPQLDPVWWWASPMGDRPLIGISYLEAVRVYEGRRRLPENIAIS